MHEVGVCSSKWKTEWSLHFSSLDCRIWVACLGRQVCCSLAFLAWDVASEGTNWYTSGRAMARANDLIGQPCPPDLPDSPEVGVLVGVERGDVDRSSQGAPHPPFVWFLLDLEVAGFPE